MSGTVQGWNKYSAVRQGGGKVAIGSDGEGLWLQTSYYFQ